MPLAYLPAARRPLGRNARRPRSTRAITTLLAVAALTSASCTTGPDGKQTFDWRTAGNITTGVISVVSASQQAPVPPLPAGPVGPFTATK